MDKALTTIATDLENLRNEIADHETPKEHMIDIIDTAVRRIRAQVEMIGEGL